MRNVLLSLLLISSITAAANDWSVGAWEMVHDEDGHPKEYLFIEDGKATGYDANCGLLAVNAYHRHANDIYITFEWPKGPVTQVYRPSPDKLTMRFNSPRTNNVSTWKKLTANPCG